MTLYADVVETTSCTLCLLTLEVILCRFHVYQYMMYTLAMWNSYLFVSALDIFVVVLAGLISIFTVRRSQKSIEQVWLRPDFKLSMLQQKTSQTV